MIAEFYGSDVLSRSNSMGNSVWNSILAVNDTIEDLGVGLKSSFQKCIANGSCSLFWDIKATAGAPKLKELFPRLFAQEINKEAPFKDRWRFNVNSWTRNWCWRSDIRGRTQAELIEMEGLLGNMNFKEAGEDSWFWSSDSQGVFTVNKLSKLPQRRLEPTGGCSGLNFWSSLVPLKVKLFTWRLLFNALPTKINLQRRGINLMSVECGLCGLEKEELDHCLFRCTRIETLWRKVWAWCGLSGVRFDSVLYFKNKLCATDNRNSRSELIRAVYMITAWAIWNWRNRVTHSSQEEVSKILQEDIFPVVQRTTYLWITFRNPMFKGIEQQGATLLP